MVKFASIPKKEEQLEGKITIEPKQGAKFYMLHEKKEIGNKYQQKTGSQQQEQARKPRSCASLDL